MKSALQLILLLPLVLAGCDQPEEGLVVCDTTPTETTPSITAFHRLYTVPEQSFLISTAQPQSVQLQGGATVSIPAQAFALASGTTVAGTVEIRVRVLRRPAEMVLSGLPAMTFWRPIETGGQIHLTAWFNGTPIRLRAGKAITVGLPRPTTASATGLSLWAGVPTSGNMQTWIQDTAQVRLNPSSQLYQMQLRTDTLGWFNAGQLWTSNPSDTTLLRADVGADPSARVYLLPTQRSGAFLMKWNSQTRLMELYGVPAGTEMNVVVLKVTNGALLVGTERTTLRRGQVLRTPLMSLSPQAAAALIQQL